MIIYKQSFSICAIGILLTTVNLMKARVIYKINDLSQIM